MHQSMTTNTQYVCKVVDSQYAITRTSTDLGIAFGLCDQCDGEQSAVLLLSFIKHNDFEKCEWANRRNRAGGGRLAKSGGVLSIALSAVRKYQERHRFVRVVPRKRHSKPGGPLLQAAGGFCLRESSYCLPS